LNKVIKNYKILNEQIIEANKNGIMINKLYKNTLIEINGLLKNEIKIFYDSQYIKEDKDNSNKDIIIKKQENKINKLKAKLSRYPFELLKGEKLISVILTSSDQKIHCSIICKNTEKFIKLEEKLYNNYPEYSDSDNYFMVNGNIISKFKTLDENNIKDSDNIILIKE
jgi:hypothetical protein